MDSAGVVGDVTFSTGSVQTVRQVRKVVVNDTEISSALRRTAYDRESQRASAKPPPLPARNRNVSRNSETQTQTTSHVDLPDMDSMYVEREVRMRAPHSSSSTASASVSSNLSPTPLGRPATFSCCCDQHGHSHHNHSHLPYGAQCTCCPYGYHIAVDFAEFASAPRPNGSAARLSTQLDSIKRRSEQLARTRDLLNEHDALRARVALASANVPLSPSAEQLASAAAAAASDRSSRLVREIGSALDVTIDQFTNSTNGHAPPNHSLHGHSHAMLNCDICARRVPVLAATDDAMSASNFSISRRSHQTVDEAVFEDDQRFDKLEIAERIDTRLQAMPPTHQCDHSACEARYTSLETQYYQLQNAPQPAHQCDHSDCDARYSALESQIEQLEQALRAADQEKRIAETKLSILTKQYTDSMLANRLRTDRASGTDDLIRHVTRDSQTDTPTPVTPPPQPVVPSRRTVGVGDTDVNDLSAFVVTCQLCEERRSRGHVHTDAQTEVASVRNVATYYRPPTRDVGIGYTLDDSPLRPATRDCDVQTDIYAAEWESEYEQQVEVTSENINAFIRTFTTSVETTTLNSTSMLRLLRTITSHMSAADFQTLFRAAFRRDVRSVELQVSPRSYSIALSVDRSDFEKEIACGDDYHRLEIPRLSSSIAVQCRPAYQHKYIWTDSPITFDVGSITSDVDIRNRATQTYSALTVSSAAQTDRAVATASYKCEVSLSNCPNRPRHSASESDCLDESFTFDDHEHVTVVVNGNVETRCVREIRSLSASTHSHNDQLIAASYRTCISSATETPSENERDESFVLKPTVPHRLVLGQDVSLQPVAVSRRHDNHSPSDSDSETDKTRTNWGWNSSSATQSQSQTRSETTNVTTATMSLYGFTSSNLTHSSGVEPVADGDSSSLERVELDGSVGSLSGAAPSGSPKPTQKSILKKSNSKPETPVATPVASPSRPKKSISFASETLVVGSSESSLAEDEIGRVDASGALHAVLYTDRIRETSLVDSVEMSATGPILSVTHVRPGAGAAAGQAAAEDDGDEDAEDDDEDAFARQRNTVLNSYTAYADLSGINSDLRNSPRDKLSSRPKFPLPPEVRAACEIVEKSLEDPEDVDFKQVDASLQVIASEWFRVVSEPNRDTVELLEDYLRAFNDDYSNDLLERVVRFTDAAGNTAMHYVLWKQQFDVADLLLSTEACDCDALNFAGYTPVMLAAECRPRTDEHIDVLRRVFENGDVNKRSQCANTQNGSGSGSVSGTPDAEPTGPTALFIAAAHGEASVVRLLLECGANARAVDKCGSTALHCAAEHGQPDSVTALVTAGADVNAADADGSTPLHCAAERGDTQIVRVIICNQSCNLLATDNHGRTPLDIARKNGHSEVLNLLETRVNLAKQF